MLTPWLSYRMDLQRAPQRFWTDLGRIEAYADTLCGFPLGPGALDPLTSEIRANAARAAAAAEFGPETMAAPGGDDLAEAVGALFDVIDRRPDAPITAQTLSHDNEAAGDIAQAVALTQLAAVAEGTGPAGPARSAGPAAVAAASLADQIATPRSWGKLTQFCDWLNGHEFLPAKDETFQTAALRAIAAHQFLLILRPFNHGAEITARLAAYRVLRASGLPPLAAHLPAIHFGATADQYAELAGEAVEGGGATIAFAVYAGDGMATGLRGLIRALRDAQTKSAWRDVVLLAFEGRERAGDRRRRVLLEDLGRQDAPVRIGALRDLSPRLADAYAGKSEKTLSRDVKWLETQGLIERTLKGVQPRRDAVYALAQAA